MVRLSLDLIRRQLTSFLSPKAKLGRKGFAIIYVLAIILFLSFVEIAWQLWFLYDPFPYWKFNFCLNMSSLLGGIGLFFCILTLTALVLMDCTHQSYVWGYGVGYGFLIESIIADLMFIIYVIQCIRRSCDLGQKWTIILIPLLNPIGLLFGKTKG
jgi:hypothetical protein